MSYPLRLSLHLHRQALASATAQEELCSLFEGLSAAKRPTDGLLQMRAPLHLALLISSIYLLLLVQLFKKSYNCHTMLNISTCLGNSRPQVLADIKAAIWKTLFSLASGRIDPFDLLHQLSDALPWGHIHAASSEVSQWLNLGMFCLC